MKPKQERCQGDECIAFPAWLHHLPYGDACVHACATAGLLALRCLLLQFPPLPAALCHARGPRLAMPTALCLTAAPLLCPQAYAAALPALGRPVSSLPHPFCTPAEPCWTKE